MEQGINNKKFYYLYKITNNINQHFYYGIHSTNNLNDGYMGSGKILHKAYKKYGIENFTKEIIKFCNSLKEVSDLEKEIVNEEIINNSNCYNITVGGYFISEEQLKQIGEFNSKNQKGKNNSQFGKCWIYKENESLFINKNDLNKYLSEGWIKGRKIKNSENISKSNKSRCWIHKGNDIRFIQKEDLDFYLKNGFTCGKQDKIIKEKKFNKSMLNKILVKDKNGNRFTIYKDDPRYLSEELVHFLTGISTRPKETYISATLGKVSVKDKNGNTFLVNKDDPRYLSGELVGVNKGKHWKQRKK